MERQLTTTKDPTSVKEFFISSLAEADENIVLTILDENGIYKYVSPNIERLLGYPPTFFGDKHCNYLIHPEDWHDWMINETQNYQRYSFIQYRMITHSNVEIWVESLFIIVPSATIREYVILSREITKRKQMEDALIQNEKLAAIGKLAAGIAHDIRNPLTSLKGFLDLMISGIQDPIYLQIMKTEIERIELTTNELMLLAKPSKKEVMRFDIQQIIRDTLMLLDTEAFKQQVQFRSDFHETPVYINGDPYQIKQVMINFVKNAIEAMMKKGVIEISVTQLEEACQVKIKDEGCGLTKEELNQIGRPFYTSKEQGNGLGLMMCEYILRNHKGFMSFSSEKNKGTTVTIQLPLSHK
ncbi:ATP-binding protein [Bacillus spongiae]|uniref:histidine kinase n=1 Tax=Bacillus spongiae TaxID=2683610 RepID=A0ABU8HIZ0_9BACI